jgi:hypothetical protein
VGEAPHQNNFIGGLVQGELAKDSLLAYKDEHRDVIQHVRDIASPGIASHVAALLARAAAMGIRACMKERERERLGGDKLQLTTWYRPQ